MQDMSAGEARAKVVDAVRMITIKFRILFGNYLNRQILELQRQG